ncbi:hypothetical protein GETHLI_08210 [Geothrix limicola]|uniref:Uncharacterized protein n=1 Tax=Geothrix limicola TaxID=2927978 RepID=A0ABQ5QCN4_9BACT|nr:hypothetical protein [Geothrix limicola]GLH72319.1 hypothetical protein GETHLI_08210 [Geothrix limicola]
MARRGSVAVHPVSDTIDEFTGVSEMPAGWKAYGFGVPPGEKIHIRLHHPNEGWFRLVMLNRWGQIEKGMLQNLIPTGNPEVSYTNFSDKPRAVYVIVDDPGWMSCQATPFSIKVTRSWDPSKKGVGTPVANGIWAQKQEAPQPEPVPREAQRSTAIEPAPKG